MTTFKMTLYPNRFINYEGIVSGKIKFYYVKRGSKYYFLDRVNISENVVEHSFLIKTRNGKRQRQILVYEDENGIAVKHAYRNIICSRRYDYKDRRIDIPIIYRRTERRFCTFKPRTFTIPGSDGVDNF